MSQYLLLIQGNAPAEPTAAEWNAFFETAGESGLFRGGSEFGSRQIIGSGNKAISSNHIAGYMRFDSDDKQQLTELIRTHPVVVNGGTVELCELRES